MKRLSYKSVAFVVVLLLFVVNILPSCIFASNVGDTGRVYLSDSVLSLSDGHSLNFKSVFNENSRVYETAYCVEHGSVLYTSTSMTSSSVLSFVNDDVKKAFLSYALAYGYKTNSNAATSLDMSNESGQRYAATQFVVWNILSDNYDSNFNRTSSWYDYVPSTSTYHSAITRYTEELESSIRRVVSLRNSGIVVFNSVSDAVNNSYGKTSMQDNRTITDVNALAERLIDFVDRIYDQYLTGSANRRSQMDYWVNKLFDGSITPERVILANLDSQECKNKFSTLSNEDFVRASYLILFNRNADASGLNYYVGRMNDGLSRVELVNLMMTTPEWKSYSSQLNVSSGNVEYYFDYEFPVGITPNASMIVENTTGASITFNSLGGNNKWRISFSNGGRIVLKMDYGRSSTPLVWTPSIANHQKVISTSDYENVSRYVAFNAYGEITYNPTATNTATPKPSNTATPKPTNTITPRPTSTVTPRPTNTATPRPTNTPTPIPINHVATSFSIIKRGEAIDSTSYNDIEVVTNNGVYSDSLCSFVVNETNLSGASFYAVPRFDVYKVVGNERNNTRELIYHAGQHLPLVEGTNGVYSLATLYGGVYDVYEFDSPDGYICEEGLLVTINIENIYSSNTHTYTSTITNQSVSSDMVTIDTDGVVYCDNNLVDVDIRVIKNLPQNELSNEDYYSLLSSVLFGLYTRDAIVINQGQVVPADTLVGISNVTVITDGNGDYASSHAEFTDPLPDGNYYVREIDASPRIVLDETRHPVNVNRSGIENNTTLELVVDNQLIQGEIRIFKYDEWYGTALIGAEFTVFNEDGTVYGIMDWNAEEELYEIDVPYGEYTVIETMSPEGFEPNNNEYHASILNDGDVVNISDFSAVGVANSPVTTRVVIYKHDELDDNHLLSGAEFMIYEDTNDNGVYDLDDEIAKSFANGEIVNVSIVEGVDVLGNIAYYTDYELRAGRYFIVEIAAPAGFSINDDYVTVINIPSSSGIIDDLSVSISNSCYGDIHITKIDRDYPDVHLSGAVFNVYRDINSNGVYEENDDVFVGSMIEEELGEYYIRHLGYGRYVVIESESPEGFVRRTDSFAVSITENEVVVNISDAGFEGIYNIRQNGIIEIRKTDSINTDIYYSDSVFEVIRDMDGDGILSNNVFYPSGEVDIPSNTDYCIGYIIDDDNDGLYQMTGLMYGTYYVREVEANSMYMIDANTYTVELTIDNPIAVVANGDGSTFVNNLRTGALRIVKHSEDGHVGGISFRVTGTDEVGNQYDETFVTDENGIIVINALRIGTYVVSEVDNEAVSGYILPDNVTVIIEADVTVNVDMTNTTPTPTPTIPVVKTGEETSSYLVISMITIGMSILLVGSYIIIQKRRK